LNKQKPSVAKIDNVSDVEILWFARWG